MEEEDTRGKKLAFELDEQLTMESHEDEINDARARWEKDMENELLRFQYTSLLASSHNHDDRLEAVVHLNYLVTSSNSFSRDALFMLATTKYTLKEYDMARACAEELCRMDPDNVQVRNLFLAIKYKHDKEVRAKKQTDEAVGVAIGVGVAAAALGIGLSFLLSKKK